MNCKKVRAYQYLKSIVRPKAPNFSSTISSPLNITQKFPELRECKIGLPKIAQTW